MMRELDNSDATSNNFFCKCSLRGKRGWSKGVQRYNKCEGKKSMGLASHLTKFA